MQLGMLSGKHPGDLTVIIVERATGRYLPVLYASPPAPLEAARPIELGIKVIQEQDILYWRCRVPGSGGFSEEWYFILDHGIPKKIDYGTIVGEAIKKSAPGHCEFWKGGNLDLN